MRKALVTLLLVSACASAPPTARDPSFATAPGAASDDPVRACTDRCLERAERAGQSYADCVASCPGSNTRPIS